MNVLVLIADSLRAQNMSLHGYDRETTPFLKKLSDKSITYRNAVSPSTTSLPSHTSIFTGLHPQEHQIYSPHSALGSYKDIWKKFQENGYRTGLFTRNAFLLGQYGLNEGFDCVDSNNPRFGYPFDGLNPDLFVQNEGGTDATAKLEYAVSCLESNNKFGSLLNGASHFLDERGYAPGWLSRNSRCPARGHVDRFLDWSASINGNWAACLNLVTTHSDYEPLPEYDLWATEETWNIQEEIDGHKWPFWTGQRPWSEREALMDLYDGTIRQVDQAVKYLYKQMKDRGDLGETILIFTSDHGEGFGERSEVREDVRLAAHGFGIDEALIHVPLLVYSPKHEPDTVNEPVSLTGIGKSFENGSADEFDPKDIEKTDAIAAYDHYNWASGFDESELEDFDFDWEGCRNLAQAGYELVDGEVLKYAKWGDASVQSPIKERIEHKWEELSYQGVAEDASVDDRTRERLEELGYV